MADGGGGSEAPTGALGWFSDLPGPAAAAIVGLTYLGLSQYVIWLNDPVNAGAGYWPAAGVTLAALLLLPTPRWVWVLGAVAMAEIGGSTFSGYPLAASSWWATGNVVEPLLGATLLRLGGRDGRLSPLGALVPFLIAGVVIAPLVGALIGSIGTSSVYGTPRIDVVLKWWAGDGLGVLVVAPLILSFRERPVVGRSAAQFGSTVAVVVIVALVAFRNWDDELDIVLPYLILPAMIVASVRLGIRGTAVAGFLVAEIANLATALGYGPFRLIAGTEAHALTVLQVFLAVTLTTALVIATLVHDMIERTREYVRHRAVADAFQASVIPETMPALHGLSASARYAAASGDDARHVGGDWYDVFPIGERATGFVVGDVAGHDLTAAVAMAQFRNGLRSLLTELGDPSVAMAAMDRQIAATTDFVLATVIAGVYEDGELRWCNAGHLPLVLAPRDGPAAYLQRPTNRILGIGDSRYDVHRSTVDPGDLVVAFTDGVVEDRTRSLDDALERVLALIDGARASGTQAVCDRLVEEGLEGGLHTDDACVLALRRELSSPRAGARGR